jgi:acyl-CoA synthetase (AMP-forming)/AMP-acid ligase II
VNSMQFILAGLETQPDKEILVSGDTRHTYRTLVNEVERLAGGFRALGVQPDDRVVWLNTNSTEGVVTFYASAKLGAGFVPVNYRAKADELHFLLSDSGAKVAVIGANYVNLVRELQPNLPETLKLIAIGDNVPENWHSYRDLIQSEPVKENTPVDGEGLAALIYTSGTTARPKGVRLTYGDFVSYVETSKPAVPPLPISTSLGCSPIYHIAGILPIISLPFYGMKIVILPQFEAEAWLKAVEKERVTSAFLVPTMVKQVLDHPNFASTDFTYFMGLAYGAAPMPLSLIERAIRSFPKQVMFTQAYGQTESSATVAVLGPDDHRIGETEEELEKTRRRLRSIGKPVPNTEIRIADETGATVPLNTVGELAVRAERVMQGYDRQEEATRNTIRDGWLFTRDMGWMDEDGYIYLAGRKNDMIIRGGENIAPEEVEQVLYLHPAVGECAVIGIPDEEWGEKVAAIVTLNSGYENTDALTLQEHCRTRLASFKKPEIIHFVDELPHNATGKILKKALRDSFAKATV